MPPLNDMWRSLDELAESDAFRERVRREFPAAADVWLDGVSRRGFLQLAGATLALAGVTGCTRRPLETIVPYAATPEHRVQGEPQWFATAIPYRGFGFGVLAKSFEGRPVKLEGNPDHPASLGATNAIVQASILDLYDPTRSTTPRHRGIESSWDAFAAATRGRRLSILTQTVTSPALLAQMSGATVYRYEPFSRDSVVEGTRIAFGAPLEPLYHFDRADVVVLLDADPFGDDPAGVRYAHDFALRRRVDNPNRLYAFEPMPTVSGAMADHRWARKASEIVEEARSLATVIVNRADEGRDRASIAVARDLLAHRGSALVIAGDTQPPVVHALAHAMNAALGAIGRTVDYIDAIGGAGSLADLVHALDANSVDALLILGGNPVVDAPADFDFAQKLARAGVTAHLSPYVDETSSKTEWHLPESHPLERWDDVRAFDGTATIIQPLIAPLYDTRSAIETVAIASGAPASGHDLVKSFWRNQPWHDVLARGVIAGTTAPIRDVAAKSIESILPLVPAAASDAIEINIRPDPTIGDGRHSRNGWLQELPKPITNLVWGNAACVSPAFAKRESLRDGDVVEIATRGRSMRAPVVAVPGHADRSVTLANAYPIFFSDSRSTIVATIRKTGDVEPIVSTQEHNTLDGRDHLRVATLAESRRNPRWAHDPAKEPARDETLYGNVRYDGHAWAMAIDLNSCIGCGACVIACNAENNIPFVGRDQVAVGREMQWLRIDRYFAGPVDAPQIHHQPVPCMHCEEAPCEPVCPVGATVHSSEGLNEMVYNRCIGTRYCSNNCPYKVRRFNFLAYAPKSDALYLMQNPDVTVRSRGVMEKCTYCVQRIERVRVAASNAQRPIRDGEIVTACQQACPSQAIVFGDANDPHSRVARLKAEPRNYAMLSELNTRPRTTYLGKIRNPNPELENG